MDNPDWTRVSAYGNTVYRCTTCGWEGWGQAATMHALRSVAGGYQEDHRADLRPIGRHIYKPIVALHTIVAEGVWLWRPFTLDDPLLPT